MKAGWEVKALGDFAEIRYGYTAKADLEEVGPHFLRITDIQNGCVDWEKVPYCQASEKDRNKFSLSIGDIVFARTGATTGKSFQIREETDAVFASYLIRVRATRQDLDDRFLSLFFQTSEYWDAVALGTEGAAQGGFNASKLAELQIPLPPLEEQKRIVAVLDAAFEGLTRARTHVETNLQNARELFDRVANNHLTSVTANEVALDEVASIPSSLVDPRLPEHLDQPHIGAGNMETGRDVLVDVKTSREEVLKSGKYTFDGSMVLYSKIRPYLRKVARPDFEGLCSADMYPLLPNSERLNRSYLFHLLMSDDFTEYAISGSDRAGMPKVNQTHLFKYRFRLPPLLDQLEIVKKIDRWMEDSEALQAHYRTKLQDLDDLRQSLLARAFAGELT